MEGISNEGCSLAGHWGLGKLIALYDDYHISIDGDTEIALAESVDKRFKHVIWIENDMASKINVFLRLWRKMTDSIRHVDNTTGYKAIAMATSGLTIHDKGKEWYNKGKEWYQRRTATTGSKEDLVKEETKQK